MALRQLEVIANNFVATLPPATSFAPGQVIGSAEMAPFVAHTTSLGALMEVHHTLIDVDDRAYETRLSCAKGMAELANMVGEDGFSKGSLMATGVSSLVVADGSTLMHCSSTAGASRLKSSFNTLGIARTRAKTTSLSCPTSLTRSRS